MPFKPDRLLVQLQNTGLANKDNPQYQLISQIIKALGSLQLDINNISGGGGGSSTTVINEITQILGIIGEDGSSGGDDGPPGRDGISGATGAQGPMGVTLLAEDGINGDDGFNIPNPGPAGATGAQGPAGPVLIPEDGINGEDWIFGIPGPAGASGVTTIKLAIKRLTDAQIKSLNTVPITIAPAAGTDILLVPSTVAFFKSFTGGTYSTGRTYSIRYAGVATNLTDAVTLANTTNLQSGSGSAVNATLADGTTGKNKDLVVFMSTGDVTGGNAANFLEVGLLYWEFDASIT